MIYLLLTPGFEELSAAASVDLLRRAELTVQTVSLTGERTVTGSHGLSFLCDTCVEETDPGGLQLLILPGGIPGALHLERSPAARAYIAHAMERGIPVGAMGAAPVVLLHMGLLAGRHFTCYPGFYNDEPGVTHSPGPVVRDQNLITASGPAAAVEFALALVACLLGQERADILRGSL